MSPRVLRLPFPSPLHPFFRMLTQNPIECDSLPPNMRRRLVSGRSGAGGGATPNPLMIYSAGLRRRAGQGRARHGMAGPRRGIRSLL